MIDTADSPLEAPAFVYPAAIHAYSGHALPSFAMHELIRPGTFRRKSTLLSQEPRTLADYPNAVLVINFWATWCTPCKFEHPDLADVSRLYDGKSVQVLSVLYEDSPSNAVRYIADGADLPFPVLVESKEPLSHKLGVRGIPQTFVVDGNGIVRAWFPSMIVSSVLTAAIDSALVASQAE